MTQLSLVLACMASTIFAQCAQAQRSVKASHENLANLQSMLLQPYGPTVSGHRALKRSSFARPSEIDLVSDEVPRLRSTPFVPRMTAEITDKASDAQPGVLSRVFGRFRRKRVVEEPAQIEVGATLPEVDVDVIGSGGEGTALALSEVLTNGTAILVGMPGAFTPTCTGQHLPSIIASLDTLKAEGVDTVAVITTNDRFVNSAWRDVVIQTGATASKANSSTPEITILSDADGDAVKALGLLDDMGFGVGIRSKRFSMITNNYTVKYIAVDEGMDLCDNSAITPILEFLKAENSAHNSVSIPETNNQQAVIAIAGLLALGYYLYSEGYIESIQR